MSKETKMELFPFQGVGVFKMRRVHLGTALLADDPGLGKTIQSIMASMPFHHKRTIQVVCPSPIKYQWAREFHKATGYDSWVFEGKRPPRYLPLERPQVCICNWEILQHWVKTINQLKPSVILLDEIQYIKSRGALRTQAAVEICDQDWINCKFALSGTPFENRPAELWPILHILWPDKFPTFTPFANRFCNPKWTHWGIKYDGATRKKELRKLLLDTGMIRRRFEDVVKDLPPVNRTLLPVRVNRKKYEEAANNITRWIIKNRPEKAYKVKYINFFAKLQYLFQYTAELKTQHVINWVRNFLDTTDQKLCVFGHHRKFLESIYEAFEDQAVLKYGGLSNRKKHLVVEEFIRKKRKRLFVGGILASGTGLDGLQAVCHNMLVGEIIWNPKKLIQMERRLHRIGQKTRVNCTYLLAEDTVEELYVTSILRKDGDFSEIIDGIKGKSDFDVLKKITKSLSQKLRSF